MKFRYIMIAVVVVVLSCTEADIVHKNWVKMSTNTSDNLYGLFFRNDTDGWAVSSDGNVLKTTDGGNSWDSQNLGNMSLEAVYFTDKKHGFIVGSHGALFRTKDEGSTWADMSLDPDYWFYDIAFWDDDNGILAGAKDEGDGNLVGALFSTEDGGDTWQNVYNDLGGISDIHLRKPGLGWLTSTGAVGSTTDAGENWDINVLNDEDVVQGAYFLTGQTGWIVGNNGLLAFTTDGGWSWQRKGQLTHVNLYSIAFSSAYDGLAVGENGKIFLTTNTGVSWAVDSNFTKSTLRDIEVVDGSVWICGDDGTIVSVSD
jgi:photosystem II stability/assembly factor-like uncharacterized protein